MDRFCQANYLYILENLQIQSLQERPTKPAHLQLVPSALDSVTSNHIFKREKNEKMKKNEELCECWKRKDGVEEVEEAGLVNKHIFWRSAGGNTLEVRDMNS